MAPTWWHHLCAKRQSCAYLLGGNGANMRSFLQHQVHNEERDSFHVPQGFGNHLANACMLKIQTVWCTVLPTTWQHLVMFRHTKINPWKTCSELKGNCNLTVQKANDSTSKKSNLVLARRQQWQDMPISTIWIIKTSQIALMFMKMKLFYDASCSMHIWYALLQSRTL